jgi:hypothetical protein
MQIKNLLQINATMASLHLDFNDIRLIICVQGYSLVNQFVVREIGFWTRGFSGSVPFNCKINKNQLDVKTQKTIFALEEEIHGIKLKKHVENGLTLSDTKTVLRTLYHMADNGGGKYIGICRDENVSGLLYKAGLGSYVFEMDFLTCFHNSMDHCPSNKDLQAILKNDPNKYVICSIHDRLRNNEFPICGKVKAEYIAEYCKEYEENVTSIKNINFQNYFVE